MSRATRARKETQGALAFAGIVSVVLLGVLIARPSGDPSPAGLVDTAMNQLTQADSYTLVIEEKGPQHSLLFQGMVDDKQALTGLLPGFELEILCKGEEFLVRKAGENNWDQTAALELQGLAGFLTNPAAVLQSVNFSHAAAGQDVELAGVPCRTVYLEITGEDQLIKRLFPDINMDTVQSANLGVALAEPGLTIKQLRVLLQFTNTESTLERVYYIEFD